MKIGKWYRAKRQTLLGKEYEKYAPDPKYAFKGCFWNYRRMITLEDCPHLCTGPKKAERFRLLQKYGTEGGSCNPFVRAMVHGRWPKKK